MCLRLSKFKFYAVRRVTIKYQAADVFFRIQKIDVDIYLIENDLPVAEMDIETKRINQKAP